MRSACAVNSQTNGPWTDEGLDRLHANLEHESLRLKFIEKTIQAILPCIRELIPRANIELVKDSATGEQYLKITQKLFSFLPYKRFTNLVTKALDQLNSIVNRHDRRYGLLWLEKVASDSPSVNLRFNATDSYDTVARDPSIECLLRSSFAPAYYPEWIHNADDLVKYQILDSFGGQLETMLGRDSLSIYDSRSKSMTFNFFDFMERNRFLKLINQYNDKFNIDLRAGVLREKLITTDDALPFISYSLEFTPTKGRGYEQYKTETLANHFLMAELIDRNPLALNEDLLAKFV